MVVVCICCGGGVAVMCGGGVWQWCVAVVVVGCGGSV